MWLQVATYSNLLFTMKYLSHFASYPRKAYWEAMKHIIVYIKSTINYEITYHHRVSK